MKKLTLITITIVGLLLIGTVITKLTVRDAVSINERLERCALYAVNEMYDNPFQRIALLFGKSRVVNTDDRNMAEIESFTFFRTPLPGVLTVFCDPAGIPQNSSFKDVAEEVTSYALNITDDDIPEGWYAHRQSNTNILLTRQETLPDIGATEGYAYGEQIQIYILPITISPEEWIKERVDLDDVGLINDYSWDFLSGRHHLRVDHETPASDARTDYFLGYDRIAISTLYPFESDSETKRAYLNLLYTVVSQLVDPTYSRDKLRDNCAQEIPRELIDDSTADYENGVVTMRWWNSETQEGVALSVLYEPETGFEGCSESVKEFLKHLPDDADKN